MSRAGGRSKEPRAVIHRRILDVADDMPDASLEKIADEVSGASPELADKVLAEYGDPSEDPPEPDSRDHTDADQSVDTNGSDAGSTTETGEMEGPRRGDIELTETQRETLGLIVQNPDATQRELAAELDVTAATISRWVNDIPEFNWGDREAFATGVLDDGSDDTTTEDRETGDTAGADGEDSPGPDANAPDDTPAATAGGSEVATEDVAAKGNETTEDGRTEGDTEAGGDGASEIDDLRQRVVAVENRLESGQTEEDPGDSGTADTDGEHDDSGSDRIDTELLHRVVSACMSSERVTEEDEIRLLDHLLD